MKNIEPRAQTADNQFHEIEEKDVPALIRCLAKYYFPDSIALLRRIQNPSRTSETLLLSNRPPEDLYLGNKTSGLTAAYFDRSTSPAIQGWIFASWQMKHSGVQEVSEDAGRDTLELLRTCRRLRPRHVESTQSTSGVPDQDVVLFGCVHSRIAQLIFESGVVYAEVRPDGKFIFECPSLERLERLPDELSWDTAKACEDLDLVMKNNPYARSHDSIRHLPNTVIRQKDGTIVTHVYLGVDGSVKTLFCTPEWRRKGLAKKAVVHLLHQSLNMVTKDQHTSTAHVDIDLENHSSIGLFESLGARHIFDAYFMRLNLAAIPISRP